MIYAQNVKTGSVSLIEQLSERALASGPRGAAFAVRCLAHKTNKHKRIPNKLIQFN